MQLQHTPVADLVECNYPVADLANNASEKQFAPYSKTIGISDEFFFFLSGRPKVAPCLLYEKLDGKPLVPAKRRLVP